MLCLNYNLLFDLLLFVEQEYCAEIIKIVGFIFSDGMFFFQIMFPYQKLAVGLINLSQALST